MPRRRSLQFKVRELTKGELRKFNALKRSLGEDIALRAFDEWYAQRGTEPGGSGDKNLDLITTTLHPLIKSGKLRIPRGGYIVRRGRGRVIVERPSSPA